MDEQAISLFKKQFLAFFGNMPGNEQAELIHRLSVFAIKSDNFPLFLLSGYAGTGKTTILGAFVKTLKHFKINSRLLAPTGRAAKVLSLRAGKSASTIHKQIYRMKSSSEPGSALSLAPNLMPNTLFVVDEASMIGDHSLQSDGSISRNLLDDLIEFVYSAKGCKLIFLGDEGQLPPVGNPHSPALDAKHLRFHYPKLQITQHRLTEVMRQQNDSTILENATIIRNLSENDSLKLRSGHDFHFQDGQELQDVLESAYNRDGMDETIVVTRSNKNANAYNNQIRSRILWFEDDLCQNDMLMVVKNNYHWMADQPEIGFIANGELMEIKRILKRESLYGFEFAHVQARLVDYDLDEKEMIILMDTLQIETPSLSREKQKELFFAIEEDYRYETTKKKRYELIMKDPYFNALQVKYAYAVTCHKAQGGQWKNVFVDQGYIPDDSLNSDYYRWLYTAVTRASERIFMVNFPEENKENV